MVDQQFEYYYNLYFDDLFRYVMTIVKNEDDTLDIVQETFIKLYQSNQPFDSEAHIKSWLLKVARNRSYNLFKYWYRNKRIVVEDINSFQSETITEQQVMQEVLDLPLKYRESIYLFYYEGYKIDEIASLLNISSNTIKTRLSRARALLKGVVSNEPD